MAKNRLSTKNTKITNMKLKPLCYFVPFVFFVDSFPYVLKINYTAPIRHSAAYR